VSATATLVQSESQFQAAVVEYAERLGWLAYHTHDSRRSNPGFPDLVLARRGRLIFAELKTEKGRLSTAQVDWLRAIEDASIEVYVWRPSLWHEIEGVLAR
jgi:hypothetical protein